MGGDSIGRVLLIEFSDRDSAVFDEIMNVLKQHPDFEHLRIKDDYMMYGTSFEPFATDTCFEEYDKPTVFAAGATAYCPDDVISSSVTQTQKSGASTDAAEAQSITGS